MVAHTENHAREYAVAAVSILGEYLGVKYDVSWLAWLAALFLWLAVLGYTRRYFLGSPIFKYGVPSLLAASIAAGTYALTLKKETAAAEQQPPVQQNTKGDKSPNINGNNNTVNYSDPKVVARLEEIKRILQEQQGQKVAPDRLLKKYPLGYVIFDIDSSKAVLPYRNESLQRWSFDWSVVRLDDMGTGYLLRLPDLRSKVGRGYLIDFRVGVPKKVGPFPQTIMRLDDAILKGEVLSITENGTVFLLGFVRNRKN